MEQNSSPDKGTDRRSVEPLDIASKVKSRKVVTIAIAKDKLPDCLNAASATGFKVEKIADEGEEFPLLFSELQPIVLNIKVSGKGYIAVSVERPEGSKDHSLFWDKLRSLDQKKV